MYIKDHYWIERGGLKMVRDTRFICLWLSNLRDLEYQLQPPPQALRLHLKKTLIKEIKATSRKFILHEALNLIYPPKVGII
jgi:hypothetical protein